MDLDNDRKYMQQALALALKGTGRVNPNPLVGAVLVKDGRIIGQGYHAVFGEAHAEVNAIESATESVQGATLYVTLEPCNHHGKTPPCTERIIREKISRVVVAHNDPNPNVTGNGLATLRGAGIKVTTGILSDEAARTNEVFIKYVTGKQPFCALKTAMTLDGKIAAHTGESRWITNDESRAFVHGLRYRYMAIMIGTGTVLKDDPELTVRLGEKGGRNPVRVILDARGRIPLTAKVLSDGKADTIVALTDKTPAARIEALRKQGIHIIPCPEKEGGIDLPFLMERLAEQGIDSVLLEGGGTLNYSALRDGIVDKVYAFIAPKIIGGREAPTPVEGTGIEKIAQAQQLAIENITRFGSDLLIEAYIKKEE